VREYELKNRTHTVFLTHTHMHTQRGAIMTLILKAIGQTILIFLVAIFMTIVVVAVTHSGSLGVLAFWGFIFLGILAFLIDEQKKREA